MNPQKNSQTVLLLLVIFNIVSTTLHYTDNAIFVDLYPEPEWFTTAGVFATLIFMTPFGLLGYWLYRQGLFWWSYLCLGFYSITSVSSPGHYLYPMIIPMSVKMHLLIWCDAIAGLSLIGFIIWSGLFLQEWQKIELN
ncbi:MAG: hypothetical protein QNJ49_17800 [Mastigocoleus sp. MO_167.B18]|uniref:hypothetical protein n=1 Tax=Mastigocoleus sp. MO_188.B34 TaxID=3036635 RepID=UPI00262BAECB|nr:hypothetical protein [Mastigocoleus sp. MO_188.B34]MDJ0697423.1 hypothetical protein [Mastigocoleus sp. MO_188.B34]MDJ0775255.1 hypothetical protein [Mastigocoleus sp. MO_167.B18]